MRPYRLTIRARRISLVFPVVFAMHVCAVVHPVFSQRPEFGRDDPAVEQEGGTPQVDGAPDQYGSLGMNLAVAFPRGEFSDNVTAAFGLTSDLTFRLISSGWLGLRLDGGMIWYGFETRSEKRYLHGVPVYLDVSTENYVVQGAIGPQLRFAGYPLSARVYGLVGMSYFETRSFVDLESDELEDSDLSLGSTGHLSDWTPSFTIGGGVRWTFFGNRAGFLAGIGLNLEWRRHGTTRYLVEGSITEVNGQSVFTPLESRADFFLISIGIWGGSW